VVEASALRRQTWLAACDQGSLPAAVPFGFFPAAAWDDAQEGAQAWGAAKRLFPPKISPFSVKSFHL